MTTELDEQRMSLKRVWEEQADFNSLLRATPASPQEASEHTLHFSAGLMTEVAELLGNIDWKTHRRTGLRLNKAALRDELADIFKYWVMLCQTWGLSPEDALHDFWTKSMVCRQRHSEEFAREYLLRDRVAVVDIDGVLADFVTGFLAWLHKYTNEPTIRTRVAHLLTRRDVWLNAQELGVTGEEWENLSHEFRTSGMMQMLPAFNPARAFLDWCRSQGWGIVLLTSRPIDKYPNLYADTLKWLTSRELKYDFLWWASNKAERLNEKGVMKNVALYVDDEPRYALPVAAHGVRTFLITQDPSSELVPETVARVAHVGLIPGLF